MSSATLPNTLPTPATATIATNKSPNRSAGLAAFPLLGSVAATAAVVGLEPSKK